MKLAPRLRRKAPAPDKATRKSPTSRKAATPRVTRRKSRQAWFSIRTRLRRALGKADHTRYQLDAVRVLPGPKRDRVILQATDGHQAVCLIAPGSCAPGKCDEAVLVPGDVLPTRKVLHEIDIREEPSGGWRAGDGKTAAAIAAPKHFPDIGGVLPAVRGRGVKPPVTLGVDLNVLGKVADALGTPKLTLLIPPPPPPESSRSEVEASVNTAVAICPADDAAGVHGIAVVTPVTPKHQADYYARVRKDVIAAEKRHPRKQHPRKRHTPTKPAPTKTANN